MVTAWSSGLLTAVGLWIIALWLWEKDSNALALVCLVLGIASAASQLW